MNCKKKLLGTMIIPIVLLLNISIVNATFLVVNESSYSPTPSIKFSGSPRGSGKDLTQKCFGLQISDMGIASGSVLSFMIGDVKDMSCFMYDNLYCSTGDLDVSLTWLLPDGVEIDIVRDITENVIYTNFETDRVKITIDPNTGTPVRVSMNIMFTQDGTRPLAEGLSFANAHLDNIMEGIRTGNSQTDLLESQGASNNIYLGQIETAVEIMDDWDSGDKCKVTLPDNTNATPLFVQLGTMNRSEGNFVITGNSTAKTITINASGYIGPIRNYHLTSRLFVSRGVAANVNGIDSQYIINPNSYLDMSIFGLMNEASHCTVSVLFEDETIVGTANISVLRLIR